MTDIEQKALAMVREVLNERNLSDKRAVRREVSPYTEALCRAIEQHKTQAAEIERLRVEAKAQFDRGYYDGITHPLEQSDALRDQLLRECLVKLRDVQGTEAPKQYACNLIKRIERVLQGQSK